VSLLTDALMVQGLVNSLTIFFWSIVTFLFTLAKALATQRLRAWTSYALWRRSVD
jgi:hypothetical protein